MSCVFVAVRWCIEATLVRPTVWTNGVNCGTKRTMKMLAPIDLRLIRP